MSRLMADVSTPVKRGGWWKWEQIQEMLDKAVAAAEAERDDAQGRLSDGMTAVASALAPNLAEVIAERDAWEESSANWQALHNQQHDAARAAEAERDEYERRWEEDARPALQQLAQADDLREWLLRLAKEWDLTEFPDERTAMIMRADLLRTLEASRLAEEKI